MGQVTEFSQEAEPSQISCPANWDRTSAKVSPWRVAAAATALSSWSAPYVPREPRTWLGRRGNRQRAAIRAEFAARGYTLPE
jgi:hypothetical protein